MKIGLGLRKWQTNSQDDSSSDESDEAEWKETQDQRLPAGKWASLGTGRKRDLFSLDKRSQDDEETEEVPEPPNKKRKLKDKKK